MGRAIKIMIMSATLDVPRTLRFLGDAEHVDVPGRCFRSKRSSARRVALPDPTATSSTAWTACAAGRDRRRRRFGFLPGVGEISRLHERLNEGGRLDRDVVQLHGSLNLKDQQKVLRPGRAPRA